VHLERVQLVPDSHAVETRTANGLDQHGHAVIGVCGERLRLLAEPLLVAPLEVLQHRVIGRRVVQVGGDHPIGRFPRDL
jgi:hypothetical protein